MKTETPNLKPAAGHTPGPWPLPWRVNKDNNVESDEKHPETIACCGHGDSDSARADAAFIVLACNHHAALVEALELFVFLDDDAELDMAEFQKLRDIAFQKARAILATVKGGQS